jgi:hypothetical protein
VLALLVAGWIAAIIWGLRRVDGGGREEFSPRRSVTVPV